MTGVLGPALAYAARGWPVFPCRAEADPCPDPQRCECKAPLTRNGFKDATTDAAVIRGWWGRWPAANVAIASGAPAVDVLDVDVATAGSGWPAFNRLKRAGLLTGARALIRTPRGGLHVYFAGTAQPCGSLTRAGHYIDFKASGGYVLAPPSRVHGKPYEVLDHRPGTAMLDWPAARRLLDPPRPLPARPGRGTGTAGLVAFVAGLPEGNRNAGLFWAGCRLAEANSPSGDVEQLIAAAVQAGLPEDEARRTVASAARKAAG